MSWQSVVKNIAPALGALVPPPFNIVAGVAIREALSLSKDSSDGDVANKIAAASLQDIQKIKDADANLQIKYKELDLDYKKLEAQHEEEIERLAVEDRKSARERESKTGDKTTKYLAYLIVAFGFSVVILVLLGYAKVDSTLAGALIGVASTQLLQVNNYYFGSSSGSARKTEMMDVIKAKGAA